MLLKKNLQLLHNFLLFYSKITLKNCPDSAYISTFAILSCANSNQAFPQPLHSTDTALIQATGGLHVAKSNGPFPVLIYNL